MAGLKRLAMFLLLLSLATVTLARAMPGVQGRGEPPALKFLTVTAEQAPAAGFEAMLANTGRIVMPGATPQRRVADLQFELPLELDQRWVLWIGRDPLERVRVIGLDGTAESRSFYAPLKDEGLLPGGYVFALPRDAIGQQRVRLELQGEVRSAPTPRILSEQQALQQGSREFALACALYAALVTLLIASLVLYPAVRDPIFLVYSAYLVLALLLVATVSGHLYALPGGGLLGGLGARGLWLMVLAFNAFALFTLTRFADTPSSQSAWVRRLDRVAMAMAGLALLPLLPLAATAAWLQAIATAAWVIAMTAGIVATVDGARRGVPMTVAAIMAMLLLLIATIAYEAMQRGWIGDFMLTRHGYQVVLVLLSVIMFVGLSSRVGQVRQRLDDETRARMQSDTRLQQERIQSGFAHALQDQLRSVAEDEVAPAALRLLCEQARQVSGSDAAVVVGSGYLGHGHLLVKPDGQAAKFAQEIRAASGVVRSHAYKPDPVQVRIDGARQADTPEMPLRAIIPMQIAAPGWAALVIPATEPRGYGADVLASLVLLARVTVAHADDAYGAVQLRRTAEHDSLTGTHNRRALDKTLAREFKTNASHDAALAVLFIDIDLFKRINDEHGHACGDLCIRSIAACLRGELRPTDVLGRYGGDEFLVLLPGHDAAAARVIAERLRKVVEDSVVYWQGEVLPLSVSIGMAARRETDREPATLLERADKALYAAKHGGRNRVCAAPAVVS